MNTADIILSILTAALVVATAIYATFTHKMMRTAERTEQFNRRPTLGIQAVSATPFPMEPLLEPILMLSIRLTNLGMAPLLQIEVDASLQIGEFEDAKLLFPRQVVPFLISGETTHVGVTFITPFDGVFAIAQRGRTDLNVSSDSEEGPFLDFGQNYPTVCVTAAFRNQSGERGASTGTVRLLPIGNLENEHSLMINPMSSNDSMCCIWEDAKRFPRVLSMLRGWRMTMKGKGDG